jgi:Zn2+/Cd2+-exporting ATPase
MNIAPKEALIRRGNKEFTVEVDDIQIGDTLMDGIVVKGLSAVNQAHPLQS